MVITGQVSPLGNRPFGFKPTHKIHTTVNQPLYNTINFKSFMQFQDLFCYFGCTHGETSSQLKQCRHGNFKNILKEDHEQVN